MHAVGKTDKGQTRKENQDAIFIENKPIGPLPNLYIVADGMGGHNAGEVASEQAIDAIADYIRTFKAAAFVKPENFLDLLVTAVQYANKTVFTMSKETPEMKGMGTTLIACTIHDGKIIMAHVGDSRAYVVTAENIKQITDDHTYVGQMLQAGQISEAEANAHPDRNIITRAVGSEESLQVDGIVRPINDTITIVLCTDGLSDMMDNETIKNIVNGIGFAEQRTQFLIEEANSLGGRDNISAILIDVGR